MNHVVYNKSFFDQMTERSLSSARVILPMLFQYLRPESIVDFGCGRGTWLKAAAERGVKELLGLDGAYVDRDTLLIGLQDFHACNLAERIDLPKRFDLAISVEVAEHLPYERAESFVADLVRASNVVLFSAALPYQGGTDHVNEQWLEFWAILFRRHGYVACDLFRNRIWSNKDVEYWYSQNLLLFCKQDIARNLFPPETIAADRSLSLVHPLTFVFNTTRFRPLSTQALHSEFEDYQNLVTSYLAGETVLPHLKTPGALGEAEGANVNLFPDARTRITDPRNEIASRDKLIQRQADELKVKDKAAADLRATLTEQQARLDALLTRIAGQDEELLIYRTSKLQRLRSAILYDKFSVRKLMKIAYLLVALATPKPLRARFRSTVQKLKEGVDNFSKRRHRIRVHNDKWPENRPLLSVIVPCFNYGHYIAGAVDSILSQTFQDFEIIVVDGGSTDKESLEVLQSFQKPKTTVYFRKDGRHLLGDNRNFGIERARGKYICCLDPDDELKPTYLEKALFLLETYHYDIVSTSVQSFGGSNFLWEVPYRPTLEQLTQANQFSVVAAFTKEMWKKAGRYHDRGVGKDLVAEDWDLWLRMMALGARAINIPEALMLYRVHDASLSRQEGVRSWEEQGREIVKLNQGYLKRKNYLLSAKRNDAIVQVQHDYLNLVNSYRKVEKKPAVLLALPFVITGGADTVFLQMAEHLVANGFDLSVVTTVPGEERFGDNTSRYEAITKQFYQLHHFLPNKHQWKDFLFYLIKSRRIEILLLAGSVYIYELLPEIKEHFPSLRVVDHLFNEFGHIDNNRKYEPYIDAHIVVNDVIKKVLVGRFGEDERKVHVIMHGIDVHNRFSPAVVNESKLAGTLPSNKFLVFFIGRFSEEKCPEKFVRTADLLRNDNRLHFVMLGHGPQYEQVRRMVIDLGLRDRIDLLGNVDDVRSYLQCAGALIIPSDIEGIPLTLMEALSLGVPVIASDVGGIPSVLQDGVNGFLCTSSDVEGFAAKITMLADDTALKESISACGRDYAVKHFSSERMNWQYRMLFQQLLGLQDDRDVNDRALRFGKNPEPLKSAATAGDSS